MCTCIGNLSPAPSPAVIKPSPHSEPLSTVALERPLFLGLLTAPRAASGLQRSAVKAGGLQETLSSCARVVVASEALQRAGGNPLSPAHRANLSSSLVV